MSARFITRIVLSIVLLPILLVLAAVCLVAATVVELLCFSFDGTLCGVGQDYVDGVKSYFNSWKKKAKN